MLKRIFLIFSFCIFLMLSVSSAHALNYSEWIDSVKIAADEMLAAQNNDGSFDWIKDSDPDDVGPLNIQGASGRGLVAAYNVTGNIAYLNAANKLANWLNTKSTALYNKDIEFLYELADAGGTDYTGFASTQAVSYINAKVAQEGGSGASAVYDRYLEANWTIAPNIMGGAKLWMIGEWGHVGQLLGNTEIYTGYTGFDMAHDMGDLLNTAYDSYDPDTDSSDYGTLGLVGILEGMAFGGFGYSNEQEALDALWGRNTTGWQDTGYKTYVLSLYGINDPAQLSGWINAGDFDIVDGVNLEARGEALLGVASAPVPEPATMLLFGLGLLGVAGIGRIKK